MVIFLSWNIISTSHFSRLLGSNLLRRNLLPQFSIMCFLYMTFFGFSRSIFSSILLLVFLLLSLRDHGGRRLAGRRGWRRTGPSPARLEDVGLHPGPQVLRTPGGRETQGDRSGRYHRLWKLQAILKTSRTLRRLMYFSRNILVLKHGAPSVISYTLADN